MHCNPHLCSIATENMVSREKAQPLNCLSKYEELGLVLRANSCHSSNVGGEMEMVVALACRSVSIACLVRPTGERTVCKPKVDGLRNDGQTVLCQS